MHLLDAPYGELQWCDLKYTILYNEILHFWICSIIKAVNYKGMSTLCRVAHSGKVWQGCAAKVAPYHKYMWTLRQLGCGMPFNAVQPKNLMGKLLVSSKEVARHWCSDTLFIGTKTADRVALMLAPAIGVSTKGRQICCLYNLYGQRSVAVENNFGGKK